MDYLKMIQKWEGQVRLGQSSSIFQEMNRLNIKQIPHRHRLIISQLARRSGATHFAFKVLTPNIFSPQARASDSIDEKEIIEYSALLQRIGSNEEALKRLKPIDTKKYPAALLVKSHIYFSLWQPLKAFQELNEYIKRDSLTDYEKAVGKTNIVAAAIGIEDYQLAKDSVDDLLDMTIKFKYQRLRANALELRSQIEIAQGQWEKAKNTLNQATELLGMDQSADQLFVLKWQSFLDGMQSQSVEPLLKFKSIATTKKHWETLREIDHYHLKIDFNQNLFNKLYTGTPYESYRSKLITEFQQAPPTEFILKKNNPKKLNLRNGCLDGELLLKPGKKIHELFLLLFYDLYRPAHFGFLFSKLYPDEYFNIESSPLKINQLIFRLRSLLKAKSIKLKIVENNGLFDTQLSDDDFAIEVRSDKSLPSLREIEWETLIQSPLAQQTSVSRSQIMDTLDLPLTTAHRFITWCLETKRLQKTGQGKNTNYNFAA